MEQSGLTNTVHKPGFISQNDPLADKLQQQTYDSNNLKSYEVQYDWRLAGSQIGNETCKIPQDGLRVRECKQIISKPSNKQESEQHNACEERKEKENKDEGLTYDQEKWSFVGLFQKHGQDLNHLHKLKEFSTENKSPGQKTFAVVKLNYTKVLDEKENFCLSDSKQIMNEEEKVVSQSHKSSEFKDINSLSSFTSAQKNEPILANVAQNEHFARDITKPVDDHNQPQFRKDDFWLTFKEGGYLGKGAFGTVTWVSDQAMNQIYAIKELTKFDDKLARREHDALRIIKEKNSAKLLRVLDLKYEPNNCFLVQMEYGFGTLVTFSEYVKLKKRTWRDEDVLELFFMLDDQAKELYNMNLCHHDIKPANIIITHGDDQFKLNDYGLAETVTGERLKVCGTPGYWHPKMEKSNNNRQVYCDINPYEADLFAIKKTINEILKGDGRSDDIDGLLQKYKEFKPHKKISLYTDLKDEYQSIILEELFENVDLDNRCVFYWKIGNVLEKQSLDNRSNFGILPSNVSLADSENRIFNKAIECHLKSPQIMSLIFGDQHPRTATAYRNLGNTYNGLGKFGKAKESHSKALRIMKANYGKQHSETATCYDSIGITYYHLGNFEQAIKYHLKSLEIRKKVLGNDHKDTGGCYNNIGLAYNAWGRDNKAIENYLEALGILRLALGEQHQNVAKCYLNIGMSYSKLEKHQKAIEYIKKSLEIKRAIYNNDEHPDIAAVYNNLGQTYNTLRQFDEAIKYSSKALEIRKNAFGEKHLLTAISYNTLGEPYYGLRKFYKAIEYYSKSLEIKKLIYLDPHPNTANSYNNLGLTYYKLGEFDKAIEHHKKALEIRKAVFKGPHPLIANSYNNLGLVYQNLKQFDSAIDYHKKALDIRESMLEEKHPNIATSYNNLGLACEGLQQFEKANEYYWKAQEIFDKSFEERHPNTAVSENNIGSSYGNLGEFDKAIEHHWIALQIFKDIFGDKHLYVAISFNNLGLSYEKKGKLQQANQYYLEARKSYSSDPASQQSDTPTSYVSLEAENN